MTTQQWVSRQTVWAVVSSDLSVRLYDSKKDAKRARQDGALIRPLQVWKEVR